MKILISYIIVLASLSGCCSLCKECSGPVLPGTPNGPIANSPVSGNVLDHLKAQIDLDPSILESCGHQKDVADGANLDDLLTAHKADSVTFGDCALRTDSLIRLLKDACNLK